MKKYVLAITMVLLLSGCTAKLVDFVEDNQVEGQHDKALTFLGHDRTDKGLVYRATPKARECLRTKLEARGWWMLQDEVDCWENSVK